jgi:flagellar basal-body rod protein FlgB
MLSGDVNFKVIGKMLDGAAARHKAIAANLANVETPGYKRRYVSFEKEL